VFDRRTFLGAATAAMLAGTRAARGQQNGTVYRMGALVPFSDSSSLWTRERTALVEGLSKLGWVEGRNLISEYRFASDRPELLFMLAAELVALRVDVIVAMATVAAVAAKRATSTIPIVMSGIGDPVLAGLVNTLAHPGGNVTGLTSQPGSGFNQKILQLLKDAVPGMSTVAFLGDPGDPGLAPLYREVPEAARMLGLRLINVDTHEVADFPNAFDTITKEKPDGIYVANSVLNNHRAKLIADFAMARRLPTISGNKVFPEQGALMSYWADWFEIRRRTAIYVDKIFKGAKPGDLPVEQPTKFELVINLKTAKALGLTIPQSLLQRADEVIH